jgi:Tetratricopeptide repeat
LPSWPPATRSPLLAAAGEEAAADSLNNLAVVLRDQGDVDGARALHECALAIYESRLGADHPQGLGKVAGCPNWMLMG